MEIVLTGSTGYLGSRVAARLDLLGLPWRTLSQRLGHLKPRSVSADCVIHCAGALRNRPDQLHAANAEGTRRLVASLSRSARIVYVSTRSVYPRNGQQLVDERAPVGPFDEYGRSKLEGEVAVVESGHPFAILRSSGIFGHPARSGIFLDRALDLALDGKPVTLASPDRDEDYVFVDWLAEMLVSAAVEGSLDGQVLNAGGPPRSLASTLSAMAEAVVRAGFAMPVIESKQLPLPTTALVNSARLASLCCVSPHPSDGDVYDRMIAGRITQKPVG